MKKILGLADLFLERSDWRDLALVKLCLFSVGIIAGFYIPTRHKKVALISAMTCFTVTFVLCMVRFASVIFEKPAHSGYDGHYVSDFEDSFGVCDE